MPNLHSVLTRLPLHLSIPAALVGLALLLGTFVFALNLELAMRQVERGAEDYMQRRGASLQRGLGYLFAQGDADEVQARMLQQSDDRSVTAAFLSDERGVITAATEPAIIGSSYAQRLGTLPDTDGAFAALPLQRAGARSVVQLSADGRWVVGSFPVVLGPGRTGTLVVMHDLTRVRGLVRAEVYRGTFIFALALLLCAVVLGLLMYVTVARRARQLTAATERFAAGDVAARAQLSGNDELAAAGRAFDAMAVQVAAAQRDLAETDSRFHRLADSVPVMMWVADAEGRCLYANQQWLQFRGRMLEQELGSGWTEGLPQAQLERDLAMYKRDLQARIPVRYEHRLKRHDGVLRCIETHTVPRYDAAGRFIGFIGVGFDITERKAVEKALRESREQLAEILSTAMDGVIAVDEQQNITLFNRAAGVMFQRSAAEVLGGPLDLLLPERFRAAHREHVRTFGTTNVMRRSMGAPGAIFGLRENGEEFPIEASISQSHIGARRFLTVIVRDITKRVQAEQQRARLEEQLRQAQKMDALGTLAGGIAHDFNNIMGAVLGNAELARQDLPAAHPARASLVEIIRATRRGKDMVSRLLAFSRPQAAQRRPLALRPIAEEALRLLRATLPAGVQIELSTAGEIPLINADPVQIHQVLLNLVTNAWHAMDKGHGRIQLHLTARRVDSTLAQRYPELHAGIYACLSVRDSGIGMDATTLARVFEPFFTTKLAGAGTGLGLSVVHGIMRGHDGAVLVDSAPGQGSIFHLYFPAVGGREAAPCSHVEAPRALPQGTGQHILYVDDDEALVFLAERALKKLNYRVTATTEASKAIDLFKADPDAFDLIVTDYNMPGMSGMELARELLRIRPSAPVVLASGYVRVEDEQTAHALGVRAVLLKPSGIDEIAALIANVLAEVDAGESR